MEDFSSFFDRLLKEAEIVDIRYNVKGFIVYRPWGMFVLKKMYSIYEKILEEHNHMPVHFPAVIPLDYFKKEEEHIKGFQEEVFFVTKAGKNQLREDEIVVLRPTSETAIYPMFSLWIKGERDLPLKVYQSEFVWRYETKATRPLIRGREILWIETHCAFNNEEEARKQIKEDMEIAYEIIENVFGIPFLFFKRPAWDKFAGAEETYAADTLMKDNKALQILTTHFLGTKFAEAFDIKFMGENGYCYVNQTTCGIGMQRILASLISWYSDEKGLFLPLPLAPIQVVIIPIYKKENKDAVINYCRELRDILKQRYRTFVDEDDKETPGFKFNKWELKGVPIRVEIGDYEVKNRKITYVLRKGKRKTIDLSNIEEIETSYKALFDDLKKANKKMLEEKINYANSLSELEKAIKNGFVRVPFCSIENDGYECYKIIKENFHAEVRGKRIDVQEKPKEENCIVCNKKANEIVYIAKQY